MGSKQIWILGSRDLPIGQFIYLMGALGRGKAASGCVLMMVLIKRVLLMCKTLVLNSIVSYHFVCKENLLFLRKKSCVLRVGQFITSIIDNGMVCRKSMTEEGNGPAA